MSDLDDLEQFAAAVTMRPNHPDRRGSRSSTMIPPHGLIHREEASHPKRPVAKPEERPSALVEVQSSYPDDKADFTEVTSYTELIGVIRAQIGVMGVKYADFDALVWFAPGLSGKVFGPAQVKRLGPEKLFDALRCAGLRLRVEIDPEQLAKMEAMIEKKLIEPRQAHQARPNNRSHLSNKIIDEVLTYLANRKGGLTVLNGAVKQARSNLARRAAKAFWEKKRERARDFSTYPENVSRIGSAPALRPPEVRGAAPHPCSAEASAA